MSSRPILAHVFLSPAEPRLRTGWRLILHGILFLVLISILGIPVALVGLFLAQPPFNLDILAYTALLVASTIISLPSVTAATWLARRFLDRRSFRSLGFEFDRHTVLDLAAGFGIAGALMASVYALESAAGWLHFDGWSWDVAPASAIAMGLLGWFVLYLAVAFHEELLFRGYYLQNLSEATGPVWGIMISSAAFGLAHLTNPGATGAAAVGILGAGLFLAFGWARTRRLWLPIGLHLGWNLFEGPVFGFPVSGTSSFRLIHQTVDGPTALTGGPFGPEAGLIVLPALLLGTALVWVYTRNRQRA
jgi:membrane protease YdiL (CAAX protease family)